MSLFGKKQEVAPGLIGVDLGSVGIKAVELVPDQGRLKLSTYGYSEMPSGVVLDKPLLNDPKRAADILTRIMKEAGMKAVRANASLPSNAIFHAIITIPQPRSSKEDLKPMIEAQVKKLLPRPLEEMILDSTVIDKDLLPKPKAAEKSKIQKEESKTAATEAMAAADKVDNAEELSEERKHIRVLISGAPKDLVAKYIAIFKEAKLELVALETEAFALIRSLIGNDKARIMIVDIGHERTNISIVDSGIPFLHRSVKVGGGAVTKVIAKQMNVTDSEAEQMKYDMSVTAAQGELPPVLKEAMMPIVHEVKYSLELYGQQQVNGGTVEKIILTGGSASLPQIDRVLTQALNTNVYIGDPWARLASYPDLKPVLNEIGPRFAVAVGLAMKLQGEKK
jgi:type IV pilus assembly protein PilM